MAPKVCFPKWIHCPDGADRIVKDHHEMSTFMGEPYGPDGQPLSANPPSLEAVLAAGYGQAAAEQIVAAEAAKAERGILPYGGKPVDQFVPPEAQAAAPTEELPEPIPEVVAPVEISDAAPSDPQPPVSVKRGPGRPRIYPKEA